MSKENSRKERPRKSAKKGEHADPHRQRESSRYDQPIASREFITSTLRAEAGPVDFEALAEKLGLTGDDIAMEALRRRVGAMIRDGQLIQNRRRGLIPVDADNLLAGRITAHPDGFGFVVVEDSDKDIYLNGKQMRQVLHGDRVVVCVTGVDHRGRREGRIVDVVERANKSLVGRLSIDRGTVVVLPDNKRIHQDLLIAPGELGDAKDGDMVVAEIIEQPTRRHQPVGKIIEVLGQHLRPGMEIDVALHSHGIPVQWPDEVLEQAAAFSTTVPDSAAKGRTDVRDTPLVTIDGMDARDFDDAVWCESLDNGWRLLVAIADVAHYVSIGSALDLEAVDRGTSVYFPGRVVPMLPEVLSNGLCSLNPEVDRLCMLCELHLDREGGVTNVRFHNGIMRSHARLTYDQVHEMLTDSRSVLRDQHAPLVPMIEELHAMYKVLARKRRKRGAIEFDSNETHIVFDENKKIKEIVPIQRNDAHKLIEECMILANINAAAYLEKKEIPALYRVHAGPKADRLEDLRAFLSLRSLSLGGGDSPTALDYAALAEAIADRQDRSVIQTVMLRSMQQAVYQPKNEGHFGLALDQYAHFTSPIRRYPDLLVHRALKFAIAGGKLSRYPYTGDAMVALGESCSTTERRAEEASRDVVSWLKCEYMQDHVGSNFDGVISAVTSFGLFVELVGIHIEGLLHVTNLSRDYYRFDQAAQAMLGERTGKQYRLGDSIRVQVAAVNLEERKIDFSEVEQDATTGQMQDSGERRNRGQKGRKAAGTEPSQAVAAAVPDVNHTGKGDKPVNAEQRRQQKRKAKQKRRNLKRAERQSAKRVEQVQNAPGQQSVEVDDQGKVIGRSGAKTRAGDNGSANRPVHEDAASKSAAVHEASADSPASRKKVRVKKAAARKTTVQKAAAPNAVAKKSASKKASSKKAVAGSSASKPVSSKKIAARRAAAKKVASKPVSSGRVASKPVSSKKVASKPVSSKKVAAKPVSSRKVAAKKVASMSVNSKKVAARKGAPNPVSSKKVAATKAASRPVRSHSAASRKKTSAAANSKKVALKKIASTPVSSKKVAAEKVARKKVASKKNSASEVMMKKTASGKAASSNVAGKKTVSKNTSSKKVAQKKVATKKTASRKKPSGRRRS